MGARQKRKPKEKWVPPNKAHNLTTKSLFKPVYGIDIKTGDIVKLGPEYIKLDNYPLYTGYIK